MVELLGFLYSKLVSVMSVSVVRSSVPGVFASQQAHYLVVIKQMLLQALLHPQKEVWLVLLTQHMHTPRTYR